MNIIHVSSYEELSRKAADIIASQILMKPNCVLGLATGSTPIGTYQNLVKKYQQGDLDFSTLTTFNLDEYLGLTGDHPQSYRYFMNDNLFNHVNVRPECTNVPDGCAADPKAYGLAYDQAIADMGGIDLQLLGIGNNGHIAFNEPADVFVAETHTVTLDKSTIEANKRFFNSIDEVPTQAITMGMGSIMKAKKVLLIANGAAKKEAIEKSFYGPITPEVPASILQLHPDLTVICNLD
ncbi:MAG: glucosamine-6-phosphate deaminase [Clostridia bacterium]|nr:glucosamine-6-phosphate deaminase [Clostridia bacterium]